MYFFYVTGEPHTLFHLNCQNAMPRKFSCSIHVNSRINTTKLFQTIRFITNELALSHMNNSSTAAMFINWKEKNNENQQQREQALIIWIRHASKLNLTLA